MVSDKDFEELGYMAESKGFFIQWQRTTATLVKERNIPINEAGYLAFDKLSNLN